MSVGFRAVQWNRAKIIYDLILVTAVALFIGVFLLIAYRIEPPKDLPAAIDLRIRAFGSCGFLMLTVILSIGPLARLDRRFLPLLYNRRHPKALPPGTPASITYPAIEVSQQP
jgi:hypothetical protein